MLQQTLDALAEGHAMLQNGLLPQQVFDESCRQLLGRLVNSESISLADRQQALISAKQHSVCQQVLLEAGQQLWQMKMASWRLATGSPGAGPSQPQGQTSSSPSSKQQQDTPTEPHSAGAQEGSDDSRPMSGFGDYGCDSGTTTSCSSMDTDPDSITEDCCEGCRQRADSAWPEDDDEPTESCEYHDEAEQAMQEAHAEADALSNLSAMSDAARRQDQNSSGSTEASSSISLASKAESDLDTDDTDDQDAVRAADQQAIKEIGHYQRMTNRLMCKFAFAAVAGDVLQQQAGADFSFDSEAVDVLQHACESYLEDAFDASALFAAHAGREKVTLEDMQLADRMSGGWRNMRGPAGV